MANANLTVKISHEQIKRAVEEALPELAELRAAAARVRGLADRLDSPYSNPSVRYMSTRIREALDGGGQHGQ